MHDASESTHVSELRCGGAPGAPGDVVRLGSTVTVVADFGRSGEVVAALVAASPIAVDVLSADGLDPPVSDPDARRVEIDGELDALEARADLLEAERAQLIADSAAVEARAAVALSLADEWEQFTRELIARSATSRR